MKRIILFSMVLLLLSSCENMLEEVPKNFISPISYYQTEADAKGAILSVYEANIVDANIFLIEEVYTDYLYAKGSWLSVNNLDKPADASAYGRLNYIWNKNYNIINRANVVLTRVPDIIMNEDTKKRILAEAYFLRAVAYTNLVRGYGAVPLRLTETNDLSQIGAPRTPVDEIYKQIIADLKIAETDLPENVGKDTGSASKWAAKIRLADVYLGLEDWANAASRADEVIKSGKYSLVTVTKESDFYKIFATETSTEDIFSSHFSPIQTPFTNMVRWMHLSNTPIYNVGDGYNVIYANTTSPLLNNWDKNDLRFQFNLYTGYLKNGVWINNPSTTPLLFKKYIQDPNGLVTYSVPVIRYAEAYLIYAEAACMAENGPSSLTTERLNIIKRRAYGYELNTPSSIDYPGGTSKEAFRNVVIKERAYEFMLECRHHWDLIRTNTFKQAINEAKNINVVDARLLHPIPQEEISNNPALSQADQNPGY